MKNEEKIIDLLTESLKRYDWMLERQDKMVDQLGEMNARLTHVEDSIDQIHKEGAKANIQLSQLNLSFMKLADKVAENAKLEQRVERLEENVFRKGA